MSIDDTQIVEQIFIEVLEIYRLKHRQVKAQKLAGPIHHLRHLAWNLLSPEEKAEIREILDYPEDGEGQIA